MLKALHITPTFSNNTAVKKKIRSIRVLDCFDFIQIFPCNNIEHLSCIHQASGTAYKDMLLFDDEMRNRNVTTELGVAFCLVRNGITRADVDQGVWTWRKRNGIEQTVIEEDAS